MAAWPLLFSACEGLFLDGDVAGVGATCTLLKPGQISDTAVAR